MQAGGWEAGGLAGHSSPGSWPRKDWVGYVQSQQHPERQGGRKQNGVSLECSFSGPWKTETCGDQWAGSTMPGPAGASLPLRLDGGLTRSFRTRILSSYPVHSNFYDTVRHSQNQDWVHKAQLGGTCCDDQRKSFFPFLGQS